MKQDNDPREKVQGFRLAKSITTSCPKEENEGKNTVRTKQQLEEL